MVIFAGAGGLFVAYLNESNLFLTLAQSFDNSIDAVTGETEENLDAPVVDRIEKNIGSGIGHGLIIFSC